MNGGRTGPGAAADLSHFRNSSALDSGPVSECGWWGIQVKAAHRARWPDRKGHFLLFVRAGSSGTWWREISARLSAVDGSQSFPPDKPEIHHTIGLIIQGAMVNDERTALELTKRLVNVQSDVVHLQAFVSVLKACVAVLLMPDDTEEALKYLSHLEELILKADPTEPARKRVLDVIEALQTLRRRGSSGLDS
jgi:hypothetical protein